ncbi:Rv1733c family protein [Streptomyces prunicolor]|uniref:Rv1733c family protein n=1 Tax=Streptomyces prunicolor TaxID=67348 RepID=UPI000476DA98|nr:hypothetical protein [Streptomyces prunicolor]
MARTRCGKVWMWRWRHNPLRRRSDVADAWILLAAWLIALCGGLLAGLAAGSAVGHGLDRQRAERHPVSAVLTVNAPGKTSASALDGSHVWATVRWTAPDGSTHTGQTKVRPDAKAGTLATVWLDRRGRLTSKPLAPGEASLQAAWTGVLVGLGAAGGLLVGAQLVRLRLARRQSRQWDEEWARVDTPWGWKAG